jgi:hypothetical protein
MDKITKLLIIVLLVFCQSCTDDEELVPLECRPGEQILCNHEGLDFPNGVTDPPPARPGQCSYGLRTCDFQGWSECTGAKGPSEEICDGIDNDCDGEIDESYPEKHQLCGFVEGTSYGVGVCTPGVMTCDNGAVYCSGHIGPSDEICDGLDNNCDGSIDEGIANSTAIVCYEGPAGTMGVGECRAGVRYCTNGGFDGPCDRQIIPQEEVCDNLDNDCDGEVDEGFDSRGVDLVFVLDISGSFDDEIESMIRGIEPLLSDPITSTFRFGLVIVGTRGDEDIVVHHRHAQFISNFVGADEFLQILEDARHAPSAGLEPTIDAMYWTMNQYPFSWRSGAQKVIITMTDEQAQTEIGMSCNELSNFAITGGYELFVFALQEHHNTFLMCVHAEQRRLFTPTANSETVFLQIRQIFEDLCIGG